MSLPCERRKQTQLRAFCAAGIVFLTEFLTHGPSIIPESLRALRVSNELAHLGEKPCIDHKANSWANLGAAATGFGDHRHHHGFRCWVEYFSQIFQRKLPVPVNLARPWITTALHAFTDLLQHTARTGVATEDYSHLFRVQGIPFGPVTSQVFQCFFAHVQTVAAAPDWGKRLGQKWGVRGCLRVFFGAMTLTTNQT
ncbi:hypothetical protein CEE57_10410 [Stenotrophomonas maltophilia]|nr:hypothetical protein CEE57_10410 [Stenotrophomonas maltophilia]